jgi:hypothetical protein
MTTDEMVVDVRKEWLQACSVQERFMPGPVGRKRSTEAQLTSVV